MSSEDTVAITGPHCQLSCASGCLHAVLGFPHDRLLPVSGNKSLAPQVAFGLSQQLKSNT